MIETLIEKIRRKIYFYHGGQESYGCVLIKDIEEIIRQHTQPVSEKATSELNATEASILKGLGQAVSWAEKNNTQPMSSIDEAAFAYALKWNTGQTYSDAETAFREFVGRYLFKAAGVAQPMSDDVVERLKEVWDMLELNDNPCTCGTPDGENSCPFCNRASEARKKFEEACAAMPPMGVEWQPIETAPKDGTWILAYCPTLSITKHPVTCFYEDGAYGNPRAWTTVAMTEYGSDEVYPTHWIPLPSLPAPPEGK